MMHFVFSASTLPGGLFCHWKQLREGHTPEVGDRVSFLLGKQDRRLEGVRKLMATDCLFGMCLHCRIAVTLHDVVWIVSL
jgi:hypothetical protein